MKMTPWWHALRPSVTPNQKRSRMLKIVLDNVARGHPSGRHSALGHTLPYLICGLEERKVPYQINAMPGVGYTIQGMPPLVPQEDE
jgi:hypothetical protein